MSAIVSFTASHYPHQHTVDTPVCLPPRRRSQPSSLKSWHYTISTILYFQDPRATYSADVLFIMDSSSDTASTYNTEKDLIKSLARYLNIDPQGTRAALVIFNGRPTVISDFESFSSTSDFESAVDEAPHLGGDRSISEALQSAAKMFTNSPASASKIIFLVTSGKPLNNEDGSSVADIIGRLSSMGVRTYVALVGTNPTGEEFRAMVENPENVFAIESQGEIPKQINRVGSHVMTDSGKLHIFDHNRGLSLYDKFTSW